MKTDNEKEAESAALILGIAIVSVIISLLTLVFVLI